jgi:hypothetical protein
VLDEAALLVGHVAGHAVDAVVHLVARLEVIRVLDPRWSAEAVVFEHARGDGGAGAEVGQVGTVDADALVAADGVAGDAGLLLEEGRPSAMRAAFSFAGNWSFAFQAARGSAVELGGVAGERCVSGRSSS